LDRRTIVTMNLFLEIKVFTTYVGFIIFAEFVTSFVSPSYGLFIHSILLVSLLGLSAMWQKNNQASNIFLCLSIAPLIRVF
jgi:hypothetical protein